MAPRPSSRKSRKSSGGPKPACRSGMKKAVKTTKTLKVRGEPRPLYEGPQGGKFYLSGGKKHCKVYLPKRKSSGRKPSKPGKPSKPSKPSKVGKKARKSRK